MSEVTLDTPLVIFPEVVASPAVTTSTVRLISFTETLSAGSYTGVVSALVDIGHGSAYPRTVVVWEGTEYAAIADTWTNADLLEKIKTVIS